ncbi:MAG TPA: DUF29 family protein [Candidatus Binataceae bacterium]|nr:DUF29 family protein [Candidatus Binataceae bacterium]
MPDRDEENRALHQRDRYAWSKATELLLFYRRLDEIDWRAVAVELDRSAESNNVKPLRDSIERLLTHLLVWNSSPEFHSADRQYQIESARFRIDDILSRSASLGALLEAEWDELYSRARFSAQLILGEGLKRSDATLEEFQSRQQIDLTGTASDITQRRLGAATARVGGESEPHEDHYAWCRAQAAAARERHFAEIDALGIAEELSEIAASIRRLAIESLGTLVRRLMDWRSGYRSRGLERVIASHRDNLRAWLRKHPSLCQATGLMVDAHNLVIREGVLPTYALAAPEWPSWTLEQVMDDAFEGALEVRTARVKQSSGLR